MPDLEERLQRTEEALTVSLAQRGDGVAFRRLVDLYDRRLLYFVRRLLSDGEEACDVVQSVWLHVHRSLRKLTSPQAFRVWLYRIAHAQVMTVLRRRQGVFDVVNDEQVLDLQDDSREVAVFDNAELVHRSLQDLTVDQRRVLVLRFLEDMSIDEISEVLDCKPGTVKSRLYYAKEALRQRIEELDHD